MAAEVIALEIRVGGVTKVIQNVEELEQAVREVNAEMKKSGKIGSDEYKQVQQQLGKLKEVQKQVRADTRTAGREFVIAADEGKRSYRALNAELVNLRMAFKELSEADRQGKIGQNMLKTISALDTELKQIDASIGNFQRNVGNYRQALLGIGDIVTGGLLTGGITQAIQETKRVVADSINVFADFERQISLLGAIATDDGVTSINDLREAAERLGSTTEFTASDVAALEIELAKLGFSTTEIANIIAPAIDAATLSGEDLGRTAQTIGSAVRAFGLDASDTGRLVDVMAASFSGSALDLSKFETSVSTVASISRVVGQDVERTSAQLGILANNGIDASTASTSLRNIFIKLAASGIDYADAMERIRTAQDPLTTAVELFDVRAANVAVTLSQQAESVDELEQELRDATQVAGGFAAQQAAIVRQDLKGSIDSLKSAYEGLQIAIIGAVADGIGAFVDGLTNVLQLIREFIVGGDRATAIIDGIKRQFIDWLPTIIAITVALTIQNAQLIAAAIRSIPLYISSLRKAIVTSRAFAVIQQLINTVMRANPIGLVIAALGILTTALIKAYRSSTQFRAVIDGLASLAGTVFNIIKETFASFGEGFSLIREGKIGAGLKTIGATILKNNPIGIALTQGKRLGDSFNKGYEESLAKSRAEEQAASLAQRTSEAYNSNLDINPPDPPKDPDDPDGDDPNGDKEKAKIEKVVGAYQQLVNKQNELANSIRDAIAKGEPYGDQLEEYVKVTKELNAANDEYKEKVEALLKANEDAKTGMDLLSEQVSNLKKELQSAEGSDIQGIVDDLVEAEKKVQEAQNEIDRATNLARGGTGVLQIDVQPTLDAIELQKQQRLLALEQANVSEEEYARRREQINLEADIAILENRLALFGEGTQERLAIETELAQKRKELFAEQDLNNFEQVKQSAEAFTQTFNDIAGVIETAGQARTDRAIGELERRYDREIELAEGNKEKIEQLEAEKDRKIKAIQKEQFERQKKLQIATALVSSAQGVVNILASPSTIPDPFGSIYKALRIGILLASTAAQISQISAQTFAKGGYTGEGGERDRTGHRVAGVVHANEYVVPAKVLSTSRGSALVKELERMRQSSVSTGHFGLQADGYYVSGGLAATPDVSPSLPPSGSASQTIVNQRNNLEFSDEQLDKLAQRIMVATKAGVYEGTVESADEIALNQQRQERLNQITG